MAGRARRNLNVLSALSLARDGAQLHCGGALPAIANLEHVFSGHGAKAGLRLANLAELGPVLAADGAVGSIAAAQLGPAARPVRAIAFNKSDGVNWSLGWHQDRTICVTHKAQIDGYGPWSVKQGLVHVEPPFALLENMLTIRLHLDSVDLNNAPLRVAAGSHRFGLVPEDEIARAVDRCRLYDCLADAGDLWVYSTAILHASNRADPGRKRRVLQVDYSAAQLPEPLDWALKLRA